MTFKHKLSRRLALLRNAALVGLCGVAWCDLSKVLGLLHQVASVTVSPAAPTVLVGATVQLTATLKDGSGNVLTGQPVTWASSAPAVATVSPSGLVSGMAAGPATITAASGGQSGSAPITVTVSTVPVASVTVSPAPASVSVGQTVQLTATLKDASGNVLSGRTVTWASSAPTVATVSPSGLVSGVAAGSATITATSEGQSGSAPITVSSAPPPSGSTVLFTESFDDANFAARGWYDNTAFVIDPTVAHSGIASLKVHYASGASSPDAGGAMRKKVTPTNTLYVSYWVKYSGRWVLVGRTGG